MEILAPPAQTPKSIDPYRTQRVPQHDGADDSFGFADMLDVINPLQHIPGVNLIYREITGDTIKTPAKLAGGAIFGGVSGFAGAMLTAFLDSAIGDTSAGAFAEIFRENHKKADNKTATNSYQQSVALADSIIQR